MSERGRGKIRFTLPVVAVCLSVMRLASGVPTANANANPQAMDTNQLPGEENLTFRLAADSNGVNVNGKLPTGEAINNLGPYLYRRSQVNPQQQQYVATYNHPPHSAYAREVSPSSGSPFFGLSSNGEFQLSAFFSQIFWGVVAMLVGTAVIIWLIRIFFPKDNIGGIVQKIKEGKSIDVDRITEIVYGALDTYEKWTAKKSPNSIGHGKLH